MSAIRVDITAGVPLARLVDLDAPVGESEAEFWHRKALERSRRIAVLERQIVWLQEAVAVYEGEVES